MPDKIISLSNDNANPATAAVPGLIFPNCSPFLDRQIQIAPSCEAVKRRSPYREYFTIVMGRECPLIVRGLIVILLILLNNNILP